jgi:hypothetical protein
MLSARPTAEIEPAPAIGLSPGSAVLGLIKSTSIAVMVHQVALWRYILLDIATFQFARVLP